jgi:hypothetical protein
MLLGPPRLRCRGPPRSAFSAIPSIARSSNSFIKDDRAMKALAEKPYPAAAARGSAALDFAGVSRTPTAATMAASAANPASA